MPESECWSLNNRFLTCDEVTQCFGHLNRAGDEDLVWFYGNQGENRRG